MLGFFLHLVWVASQWPGQQQTRWQPSGGAKCLSKSPLQLSELKIKDLLILQTVKLITREGIPNIFLQAPLFLPYHLILLRSIIAVTKPPYQNIDPIVLTAV